MSIRQTLVICQQLAYSQWHSQNWFVQDFISKINEIWWASGKCWWFVNNLQTHNDVHRTGLVRILYPRLMQSDEHQANAGDLSTTCILTIAFTELVCSGFYIQHWWNLMSIRQMLVICQQLADSQWHSQNWFVQDFISSIDGIWRASGKCWWFVNNLHTHNGIHRTGLFRILYPALKTGLFRILYPVLMESDEHQANAGNLSTTCILTMAFTELVCSGFYIQHWWNLMSIRQMLVICQQLADSQWHSQNWFVQDFISSIDGIWRASGKCWWFVNNLHTHNGIHRTGLFRILYPALLESDEHQANAGNLSTTCILTMAFTELVCSGFYIQHWWNLMSIRQMLVICQQLADSQWR